MTILPRCKRRGCYRRGSTSVPMVRERSTATAGGSISARGSRGSFLPIADMELNQVTEVESDGYSKIAAF